MSKPPIEKRTTSQVRKDAALVPIDTPLLPIEKQLAAYVAKDSMSLKMAARATKPSIKVESAYQWALKVANKPAFKAAVADMRNAVALASGMTKKKVIDGFLEAIDMARTQGEPLVMVSGWREIGKMCGFYEPTRAELTISVGGQIALQRLESLSDTDLLKLVQQGTEAIDAEFQDLTDVAKAAQSR